MHNIICSGNITKTNVNKTSRKSEIDTYSDRKSKKSWWKTEQVNWTLARLIATCSRVSGR